MDALTRTATAAEAWDAYRLARSAGPHPLTNMGRAQRDAFIAGWVAHAQQGEHHV